MHFLGSWDNLDSIHRASTGHTLTQPAHFTHFTWFIVIIIAPFFNIETYPDIVKSLLRQKGLLRNMYGDQGPGSRSNNIS